MNWQQRRARLCVRAAHGPEHARLLRPGADHGFASMTPVPITGSNKQVLAAEFRVTHALGVFLERTRLQFGSTPPLLQ